MNARSRFSPALVGTPLHQRLVENDYLSNRDYQSTQNCYRDNASTLSYPSYTPPALLSEDSSSLQEHSLGIHTFFNSSSLSSREVYSSDSLPYQSRLFPCWLTHGFMCCQCIRTNELGVLENLGRFTSILEPGFHCIPLWPWTQVATRISLVRGGLYPHIVCRSSQYMNLHTM